MQQSRVASRAQIRQFSALQATFWAFIGTFYAFIISMLFARGVSSETIGILTSVMTLGGCLGQFIVSYFCDRLETCKSVFIVTLLVLQLSCCAIFWTDSILLLSILMFIVGFAKQPLGAVLDTWFIKGVSDDMRAFGKTRSAGSAGFSILILFYGSALTRFGYGIMPYVSGVFLLALLLLAFKTPDIAKNASFERSSFQFSAIGRAVTPLLLLLFIATTLLGGANNASYNMMPVILTMLGGTTTHQGLTLFINAGMEVPAMRLRWDLLKLSPLARLLISSVLYVGSTLLMAYSTAVWQMVVLMGVNGFAFGMQLHARRAMVTELSPAALQGTMHGLGDMLYSGLGPIVTNVICGYMIGASGMRLMLLFCVALQLLGTGMFGVMLARAKTKSTAVQG